MAGRRALRVELTDKITFDGRPGVDYVDQPTFLVLPAQFTNGTIEVDILSRLNGKAPADARAFAGIAYRITDGGDRFECFYLRPLNGRKTNPPPPRHQRAIQPGDVRRAQPGAGRPPAREARESPGRCPAPGCSSIPSDHWPGR